MCKTYIITYYNIHNNYAWPIGPICHLHKVKLTSATYVQYEYSVIVSLIA